MGVKSFLVLTQIDTSNDIAAISLRNSCCFSRSFLFKDFVLRGRITEVFLFEEKLVCAVVLVARAAAIEAEGGLPPVGRD